MPHFWPGFTHKFAGLPVHDFHEPFASEKIRISSSAVFISGAATYSFGQTGFNARANARISSFFCCFVIFLGSAIMPDFAPPNGKSANAHL